MTGSREYGGGGNSWHVFVGRKGIGGGFLEEVTSKLRPEMNERGRTSQQKEHVWRLGGQKMLMGLVMDGAENLRWELGLVSQKSYWGICNSACFRSVPCTQWMHRFVREPCFVLAGTLEPHWSGLLWTAMLISLAIVIALPKPHGIRALIASTILRLIFSVGLQPTLFLLGAFNVSVNTFLATVLFAD